MPVLTRFRLDGGTNQQAARKLLPQQGLLRRVVNFDLRRDNELAVRPGFTALGRTMYGGNSNNLTACDLFAYDDRLFALGTLAGSNSERVLLFEYLGAVKDWGVFPRGESLIRFPGVTRVRSVARSMDQDGAVFSATCAVRGGLGVVAYGTFAAVSSVNYALAFRTADGAPLFERRLGDISGGVATPAVATLVSVAGKFHLVGLANSGAALKVFTVDPASDSTFPLSASSTLQTVDTAVFAASAVVGSTGGYVTVGCLAGDLVVRHYNDSHVQQMTRTITGVVPNYLAIAANSTIDTVLIGYVDNADTFPKYRTIKLTDGTNIAGPTTLIAATTTGAVSVDLRGGATSVAAHITSTTPKKAVILSGVQASTYTWHDTQLTTEIYDSATTPFDVLFAGFIQGNTANTFGVNVLGVSDQGSFMPGWFQDFGTAVNLSVRLGSLTRDSSTGKLYAVTARLNNDQQAAFDVVEFSWGASERRQTAVQGGLIHVAGGLPAVFDGSSAAEIGFGEKPVIYSLTSSNGAGSITSSAAYFIQAFAEMIDARGNVHRGPPSEVYSITTGAADDTITGTIGGLHSFRNQQSLGASYRIVICRTAALADKTAGENLYRETFVSAGTRSASSWGAGVAFTLTTSDDGLRALGETQGTIYTQGQTPVPHQAPPPFSYCWPTNERLAIGGLPQTNQWLQSKLKFPAEPVNFTDSDLPGYQGTTDEAILAVASIEGQIVAFTRRTISLWSGEGPDESGQGSFSFCGFLTRQGGINGADGWKSLCETDDGIFFQRDDEQICLLGHNGSVEWGIGQNVRDELVTYPVVNGACFIRKKHQIVFAVENNAGNAGELLVYDLRRKQWFIWDIWAKALAEYQGRLCYADSSGVVYQQNAAAGTGALPIAYFETFDFDFGTGLSWGECIGAGIVGTKQGDCTVALGVSFDSGDSYSSVGSWTATTANGYTTGKPIEEKKALPDRKHSRFALKVTVSGGSDTLAAYLNEVVLETEKAPGMTRLPARDTQ